MDSVVRKPDGSDTIRLFYFQNIVKNPQKAILSVVSVTEGKT